MREAKVTATIISIFLQCIHLSHSSVVTRKCGTSDVCQDQHVIVENTAQDKVYSCGIWFAPSSIPNAGLGVFAGRNFTAGEELMMTGDAVIPIVDMEIQQGTDWNFMYKDYTWNAVHLQMESDGVDEVIVASPGVGSAMNSIEDLQNVEELFVEHSLVGLHRQKDPGAGGFSPYHNRKAIASIPILEGQEMFVSYGDIWFLHRRRILGPIPVKGDLQKANMLLKKWNSLRIRHESETSKVLWQDIIETFAWESPFKDTSRIFFSLPKTWHDMNHVLRKGLMEFRREKATRSLKWLEHHGICADNFRAGLSDIPQAGRGAFATRFLAVNSIVAPLPMIHIPYRERLSMYLPGSKDDEKMGQQLILNYCFGHRESTMLLCPYGPFTSFINHGRDPNVILRWSDPIRSSHSPEWLNKSVDEFTTQEGAVLTMELVAIRNIEKDEEILLDYGDEWEKAWNQHVENWVPVAGADSYVSAEELNLDMKSRLKTVFEQIEHPYPSNLELFFDLAFLNRWDWIHHLEKGSLSKYRMNAGQLLARCDILKSYIGNDGRFSYDTIYADPEHRKRTR